MGKIRIKSFEETSAEDEAKLKARREQKKADKARVSGMGGGQRVKTVGPTEEEIMAMEEPVAKDAVEAELEASEDVSKVEASETETAQTDAKPAKKAKKEKFAKKNAKVESKRHKTNLTSVSVSQKYTLDQAIEALKKFK